MKFNSVFEIIGPIMVGPSSSHTAGAARLGKMARYLAGGDIDSVEFLLHGSFAQTYQGHGTDKALLAGIMDIDSSDYRLRDAFSLADEIGLKYSFKPADLGDVHPNTVKCAIVTKDGQSISVTGSSIGGGNVVITCIDDINVYFTGENPILVTKHSDTPGVLSKITTLIYKNMINIGNMKLSRIESEGADSSSATAIAAMYIELEGKVDKELVLQVREIHGIKKALLMMPL